VSIEQEDTMTADINTINKIKKLLALGQANSGATEGEAESAMSMAAALMLKYNVQVQLDGDDDKAAIKSKVIWDYSEIWHQSCASAAGYLYSCRPLIWRGMGGGVQFVGRPDNIDAAQMTLAYLAEEVERLYKLNLPKGMSKNDRAEFRRTFKFACALRIAARAWAIMETLRQDDLKAIEATGSTALVIVQNIDAQLAEADALLGDVKKAVARTYKGGLGTSLGKNAGDTVQLQKQVS
jgi:hypothetical protein